MVKKILAISLMLLSWFSLPLYAQVDFRNTDHGRPILIEDAYPIEFLAFELQGGLKYESGGNEKELDIIPELRFGVYRNLQIGIETSYNNIWDGGRVSGTSDTIIHLLYNFNQEGLKIPALAFRLAGGIPTGGLGTGHVHASAAVLATKSFRDLRLHSNLSYTIGPTASEGEGGDLSRYFYGLGIDYAWPLKFVMVMGDIVSRKPIDNEKSEVLLELGTRMQIDPKWVFDIGIGTGAFRERGSDLVATAGLTYIFGVRRISLPSLDILNAMILNNPISISYK